MWRRAPASPIFSRRAHLDVEVHVLEVLAPDELARLDLGLDLLEALDDGIGVFGGDDALLAEHLRVRDGGFDVVRIGAQS